MARSVSEIKKTMTDAFMADATIREKYGLSVNDTFSSKFSSVSIENILFFIVAACCHVLEVLFDNHKSDVEEKISMAVVASVPWYYKMALAFQYGDSLILNDRTQQYEYATIDESKQVVKYAAVRDKGTSVQILVSGDQGGSPVALSNDVLAVFKQYMNRVKVAGVILNITSNPSDSVTVTATITIDPLVLNENGELLSDGSKPVEDAITSYLKHIIYGGTFNKTKLVDVIQAVEGVVDVELEECKYRHANSLEWTVMSGNNYTGKSGSYIPIDLARSLTYVVQD
ncbi:MAG: hypothetical protein SPH53_06355 [Bacteroidaceae bacterium]|nr:hypothetical protein [Bacteroidaceae bacterium]